MPLPKVIIDSPPVTPAKFGILSAALVRDLTDPHTASGVQWQPEYCGAAHTTAAACTDATLTNLVAVDDEVLRMTFSGGSMPSGAGSDVDLTVDYGDGNTEVLTANNLIGHGHDYAAAGDYTITVTSGSPWNIHATIPITIADPVGDPNPHTQDYTLFFTPSQLGADDRGGWVESYPFELYHLSLCRLPGLDDRVAYAERALSLGEDRGVEEAFNQYLQTDAVSDIMGVLDGGVSAHPKVALARLEAYAGLYYGGTPVIYMNRQVASYLLGEMALVARGDKLYTQLGSLVVAGVGGSAGSGLDAWPTGPTDWDWDAGTWMWASGTLVVTRRPVESTPEVIIDSTGDVFGTPGITNDYLVLSTRQESIGFECFIAAHAVDPIADAVGGGIDGGTP